MIDLDRAISASPVYEQFYLIPKSEQPKLDKDICFVNQILENERIGIDRPFIPELNYDVDPCFKGPCNYSKLKVLPLTPTGKSPKYKYCVRFATFKGDYLKDWGNDTFGDLYYLPDGSIGKARIIMWRDKMLTVVHMKLVDNQLSISKIERK